VAEGEMALAEIGLKGLWAASAISLLLPKGKKFPCPPSSQTLIDRHFDAISDLLLRESRHRTNSPLENGGWIYQKKNGKTFLKKVDVGRRNEYFVKLKNPPNVKGARVVAWVHSHPYKNFEQEAANREGFDNTRPSQKDVDIANEDQMPDLVVQEHNPKGEYDPKLKPGEIWVRVIRVGPDTIPDKNCKK
jgi:hypothetical protein